MIGSKAQVWHGSAVRTSGGLTKDKLMVNKRGRIVSKKKHLIGQKAFAQNNLQPRSAEELEALRPKGGKIPETTKTTKAKAGKIPKATKATKAKTKAGKAKKPKKPKK